MGLTKVSYAMINGEFINVLDFGADSTGVADSTTAFQAAIDSAETTGNSIFVPAGSYSINQPLVFNASSQSFVMCGAGKYNTKIIYKKATGIALSITSVSCVLQDFGIYANAGGSATCSALEIVGADRPQVLSVLVNSKTGSDRWQGFMLRFVGATNEAVISDCHFLGVLDSDAGLNGVVFTNSSKAVGHTITDTIIYNCSSAVYVESNTNPGIEGIRMLGGEYVGVSHGVYCTDSTGGYTPPYISICNLHINSSNECVYVNGYQSIFVNSCLFYSSGNSFFYMNNIVHVSVSNVQMFDANGGAPSNQCAFIFNGTLCSQVNLNNNYIETGANTGTFVYFNPTCVPYAITIVGNQCNMGNWFANRELWMGGVLVPTLFNFSNNTPVTPPDVQSDVSPSGTTLNVTQTRSEFVMITGVSGASTISTVVGTSNGRVLTLKCDTAGVTLHHNANLILAGSVDFVFTAGGKITLVNMTNNAWQEIARAN